MGDNIDLNFNQHTPILMVIHYVNVVRVLIRNDQAFSLSTMPTQDDYLKVQEVKYWCIFKALATWQRKQVSAVKIYKHSRRRGARKNVSAMMLPRFLLRVNVPLHT